MTICHLFVLSYVVIITKNNGNNNNNTFDF